jgi:MFS family permease
MNKPKEHSKDNSTLSNVTISNGTDDGGYNVTFDSTTVSTTVLNTVLKAVDGIQCPPVLESKALHAEFSWDKKLQGLILGAFFWGYTAMQIPSGFLSDRFGPRLTVALGMFPVAVLTICSPWLARGSPYLLLIGRALIGVGEVIYLSGAITKLYSSVFGYNFNDKPTFSVIIMCPRS